MPRRESVKVEDALKDVHELVADRGERVALEESLAGAEAGEVETSRSTPRPPARGVGGGLFREMGSSGLPECRGATFWKRPLYLPPLE